MTARQNPRQQRDWVLSQVRVYRLGGSDEVRLPQIICVHPSREWVLAQLRAEAVRCFGAHNHKAIASHVGSRNATQVRSHSQKFFKKLESHRGRGLPTMLRKRKGVKDESGL